MCVCVWGGVIRCKYYVFQVTIYLFVNLTNIIYILLFLAFSVLAVVLGDLPFSVN